MFFSNQLATAFRHMNTSNSVCNVAVLSEFSNAENKEIPNIFYALLTHQMSIHVCIDQRIANAFSYTYLRLISILLPPLYQELFYMDSVTVPLKIIGLCVCSI